MLQMNLIKKLKTAFRIRLSSDNRFLCHNTSTKTVVYDLNSWEKIIELNKPNHPGSMRFSKNNEYLLIKNTIGTICVYDTADFQLVKNIQSKKTFKLVEGEVNFTQDNLLILDILETNNGRQIASINIHSGEHTILTEFENDRTLIKYNHFVKNENYHLFTLSYVNNKTDFRENKIIKVKEPINKQSIEVISHPEIRWDSVIFDSIHDVYILVINYEITLVDSDFKRVLKKKSIANNDYYPQQATKNGAIYYYHINAQYQYDAWGNILSQSGTMASSNPYRYAGYRYDESIGLY
jgi:hypothetical protein